MTGLARGLFAAWLEQVVDAKRGYSDREPNPIAASTSSALL
jgi:hypothetical protein